MYKIYAPKCALPGCLNHVDYHRRYIKEDGTPGWKWKTFCEQHRRTPIGKSQVAEFFKRRGGCENRNGQLGWTCMDPDTPSLTIDHVNGNKHDDHEENLMVLCANCHNRKTKTFGDYKTRYHNVNSMFDNLFYTTEEKNQ